MAKEIIEGVNPTRMELLQIRKRKALAVKGHELLSQKRDALVSSFFDVIKKREEKRKEMEESISKAFHYLMEAEMIIGTEMVRKLSEDISKERSIKEMQKNIMGVKIKEIGIEEGEALKYGFLFTNSSFDEAIKRAKESLNKIVEVASIESSIQKLGKEIEKTKRRVNALEHIFIPRIISTISYIERQLEEREREDFFRRKRMKALMEKHES